MRVRNLTKTRYGVGVLAVALAFSTIACAPQDQSAELGALTQRFTDALNAGDLDGLTALYSDDCVLMPPNTELGEGHGFVRGVFGGMMDAGLTGGTDTLTVAAAGGVGYHAGTYWLQTPDGTVVDRGKFVEGWRKIDGEWKMAHDIFNSDWAQFASATTLAITHDVKDGDHWLAAWTGEGSRHDMFAQHGVANVRVLQNPDTPTEIGLLVDVTDMDAFHAFLNSEEGAAAKAEDGVIDKGMRVYKEVK